MENNKKLLALTLTLTGAVCLNSGCGSGGTGSDSSGDSETSLNNNEETDTTSTRATIRHFDLKPVEDSTAAEFVSAVEMLFDTGPLDDFDDETGTYTAGSGLPSYSGSTPCSGGGSLNISWDRFSGYVMVDDNNNVEELFGPNTHLTYEADQCRSNEGLNGMYMDGYANLTILGGLADYDGAPYTENYSFRRESDMAIKLSVQSEAGYTYGTLTKSRTDDIVNYSGDWLGQLTPAMTIVGTTVAEQAWSLEDFDINVDFTGPGSTYWSSPVGRLSGHGTLGFSDIGGAYRFDITTPITNTYGQLDTSPYSEGAVTVTGSSGKMLLTFGPSAYQYQLDTDLDGVYEVDNTVAW